MKNFKLFLESKALEELFLQEVIDGDVTITHRINNIKTKVINGNLKINTDDFGDLSNIEIKGNLSIDVRKITTLEKLPKVYIQINCSHNNLTSFEHISSSVKEVHSRHNFITSFKYLPKNTEKIDVSFCKIKSFKFIPNNTKIVYVGGNKLKSFKHLPDGIEKVYCYKNNITSFEFLPPSVKEIDIKKNPIHKLYKNYDNEGENVDLVFLLKLLKLDSNIHHPRDISPILNLAKGDYTSLRGVIETTNVTLETHTTQEIVDLISTL